MPKQPNQASKPPVGSDDSAYNHDRPPTWKPVKPAFMYVHYLRKDTDPIKVYLFQISQPQNGLSRDDVSRAISAIQSNSVPSITKGDRGIEWRALSYMVFVLGETTEAFMQEGIKFQCEDSMKNFTFLEPAVLQDKESLCWFYYCTNFRRKMDSNPLDDKSSEKYTWIAVHSERGTKSTKIHTDSGQNTGP